MCSLLTKSRTQRQKLLLITRKREQLQTHLETLETSELNQQVISSVKETSHVLRSMGLTHNVDTVDELMQDMADSHDDVRLIQSGLATNVGTDPDSADLEAELALLMSGEDDGDDGAAGGEYAAPSQSNSMTPALPARQPTPATPAAAVAAATAAAASLHAQALAADIQAVGSLTLDSSLAPHERSLAPPERSLAPPERERERLVAI